MVRLISAFEVPADEDAAFIASWEQARDLLSEREGATLPLLHRALRPDVAFRFVSVARVESPKAWRQPRESGCCRGAPSASAPGPARSND